MQIRITLVVIVVSLQMAQPIRFLLHYVGETFEDKMYDCGPGKILKSGLKFNCV